MTAARAGTEPADAWPSLRAIPGVGELPLPWPVAHATRLGLHASARRFYRLSPTPADRSGDSRVLVLYEHDDPEAVERYERTARWFLAAGVRVPRIFARSGRALLVEDGGDLLLAEAPGTVDLGRHYDEAVRIILALQDHGRAVAPPNPHLRLDVERLRRELAFTEEHALRGWLEVGPSPSRDDAFDRLAEAVGRQPTRLCHRDYHSRNLMVGDELMVLDFQDAMIGPLFYDLASLLRDDYREVPAEAVARAVEAFWEGARQPMEPDPAGEAPHEPAPLPPAARQGLALTGAQRSLKALGTFGYQVTVAGRHAYAGYARRTWRHARSSLAALGWHDLIRDLAAFDRL